MPNRRSMKSLEKRLMIKEAYRDKMLAEVVAIKTYPSVDVGRGEVLIRPNYEHPALVVGGEPKKNV